MGFFDGKKSGYTSTGSLWRYTPNPGAPTKIDAAKARAKDAALAKITRDKKNAKIAEAFKREREAKAAREKKAKQEREKKASEDRKRSIADRKRKAEAEWRKKQATAKVKQAKKKSSLW